MGILEFIENLDRYSWGAIILIILLIVCLCIDAFEDDDESYESGNYD
ncbi:MULTISPECIES: hypothetical protein [unclassified Serratia (in: enterobacteria)]|nr:MULTISPECIES: hypothetical protein [unclassified Serratia (in: enterobacteria)]MDQ7101905.1 hypothetical protein [Serratia sp. MF2]MDQ7104481.1 hypothetical protein [Serratia sp. MF1(2023)]